MKKLIFALTLSTMLFGCTKERSEEIKKEEDTINFNNASIVRMPKMSNSDKRGFSDLNCDGIQDMIEINDESDFFSFNNKYELTYFEGYINNKSVNYKTSKKIPINIDLSIFREGLKIDTGDINGDKCDDIIFTSVISNMGDNTKLQTKVAFNLGDLNFVTNKNEIKMVSQDNNDFQYWFNQLVEDISYSEDDSLNDYLKMDWADFDGNGTDDLVLFIDEGNYDLSIAIFYTNENNSYQISFSRLENFYLENFLYYSNVSRIDTGDVNGDGLNDIIIDNPIFGDKLKTGFAINKGDSFVINNEKTMEFGIKTDLFSKVSKRDMFDDNNDGKDDIVFITEKDDIPIKIVFTSN